MDHVPSISVPFSVGPDVAVPLVMVQTFPMGRIPLLPCRRLTILSVTDP